MQQVDLKLNGFMYITRLQLLHSKIPSNVTSFHLLLGRVCFLGLYSDLVFDDSLFCKNLISWVTALLQKGCLILSRRGVKYKVFINKSYSTSRSSEVEEVNGFSGTLKNVSMSVSARWSRLQMSWVIFVAVKLFFICTHGTDIKWFIHTFKALLCLTHTS